MAVSSIVLLRVLAREMRLDRARGERWVGLSRGYSSAFRRRWGAITDLAWLYSVGEISSLRGLTRLGDTEPFVAATLRCRSGRNPIRRTAVGSSGTWPVHRRSSLRNSGRPYGSPLANRLSASVERRADCAVTLTTSSARPSTNRWSSGAAALRDAIGFGDGARGNQQPALRLESHDAGFGCRLVQRDGQECGRIDRNHAGRPSSS
jgi:hypothetical protein